MLQFNIKISIFIWTLCQYHFPTLLHKIRLLPPLLLAITPRSSNFRSSVSEGILPQSISLHNVPRKKSHWLKTYEYLRLPFFQRGSKHHHDRKVLAQVGQCIPGLTLTRLSRCRQTTLNRPWNGPARDHQYVQKACKEPHGELIMRPSLRCPGGGADRPEKPHNEGLALHIPRRLLWVGL